jgi:hypothetical protein
MHSRFKIVWLLLALLTNPLHSQETTVVYSADKPIWDLRNFNDATNMSASDDGTSQAFGLGFDFTFFGETFNQAYMASNGCLIFGALATGNNWEKNCTQYNPSPEPNTNYTMYPFWTDLIMGDNSSMLAQQFDDKVIFGWYEMWEYYRDSKNTFELWLYPNDSYEARYGELDIKEHDVFIGIQGKEDEVETYYFHDECNTGAYNSKECYNYDWNNSDKNQNLENGGSLFVGEVIDCSDPLNDSSCSGYADAFQTQQCNITQLYNESCPLYWEAYDDQQCDLDPQYGPFCQGYKQEDSVAYYEEEQFDYGYEEEQFGYEDPPVFDEYVFEQEQNTFEEPEYTYEEEIIFEQIFSQAEQQEPFETVQDFQREEEIFMPIEELLIGEFIFQETFLVEDYSEPDTFIELETVDQLEEWFEEETRMEEELANLESPEEEFIEEIFEEDVVEEIFEDIEERMAEAEIEEQLEREEAPEEFEENFVEEFQMAEREEATGKSSITRELALSVISSAVTTAQNSISGTTAGSFSDVTSSSSSDTSGSSAANSGISNSPSMSDQFASFAAQTDQMLDMSNTSISDSSFDSTALETETSVEDFAVVEVAVENTQNQIDSSIEESGTTSETNATVASIVAENLQLAQEQAVEQQEESGEYGSENAIIAVMGFLPGFNDYRLVSIPQKEVWYEPKSIYTTNSIQDNTAGFYQLVGTSIKTLTSIKEMQPPL